MNFSYPQRFRSYLKGLDSAPMQTENKTIGWYSVVLGADGEPLGGGTAESTDLSKRIAIAESLEKLEVLYGLSDEERKLLRCEEFPTRCGLAAGFEEHQTNQRAIAEGIERWAWSKWIDDGYQMPEIPKPKLTSLAEYCFPQFDEVKFFEREITHSISNFPKSIRFCAAVGFKDGGAFPGSRLCGLNEDPWAHALVESMRNVMIYQARENRKRVYPFLMERLSFFATHASEGYAATQGKNANNWPIPELDFFVTLERKQDGYLLARSLCKHFIPWHMGTKERFVF